MQLRIRWLLWTLLLLTVLAYLPSLHVPFYLDDFESIVYNPVLNNPSWQNLHLYYPFRELGYWSFSWHQEVLGDSLPSYHTVNILLHIITSLGVYCLSGLIARQLGWHEKDIRIFQYSSLALFLLAPLNTQAVTYIVQRVAVMSAMFYVLGLCAYLLFRRSQMLLKWGFLVIVLLCFFAGMLTKQNMATFPLALLIVEVLLFKGIVRRFWAYWVVGGAVLLVSLTLVDSFAGFGWLERLSAFLQAGSSVTRWQYFSHQLVMLWIYAYKLLIPHPLLLEYGATLYTWSDMATWFSAAGHIAMLALAIYFWRAKPHFSLLIFLYYLLHSVESGFIPIYDLAFEHRAYLPNIALVMLVSYLVVELFKKDRQTGLVLMACVVMCFTILTFQRNKLWADPMQFYRHELTYTLDSSRAYGAMGVLFAEQGDYLKAEKWLKMAVQVGEETQKMEIPTIVTYMNVLFANGEDNRAKRMGALALKSAQRGVDKAQVLVSLANHFVKQNNCSFALGMLNRAKREDPNNKWVGELLAKCSTNG